MATPAGKARPNNSRQLAESGQKEAAVLQMPMVTADDGGIRPAGPPDACFFCRQKVGERHLFECETVEKRVRLKYVTLIEADVPLSWTKTQIEFHRNQGSWCANNSIRDIQAYVDRIEVDGRCLCDDFEAEFLSVVDETPRKER